MTSVSTIVQQDLARIATDDLPWGDLRGAGVLVTGATGMIPSYAVLALLEVNRVYQLGLRVYALGRSAERARSLYGSLLDQEALIFIEQDVVSPLPQIPGLTHIIHGASAAQPSRHASDPVGTLTANITGTQNLLETARESSVSSFTLMSSAEVYGDTSGLTGMISEGDYGAIDILNPRACYSEGKRASETFAAVYHYQHGIPFTAARFGHIYGPGLSLNDGRVQADFARDVIEGNDITLKSAGLAQRTYTYVADAVSGMFTAILNGENGAYNISDASGLVAIRELALLFVEARPGKALKLRFEEEAHQFATSTVQFQGLDSSKLNELGWTPKVSMVDGVDRFISHLEQTVARDS